MNKYIVAGLIILCILGAVYAVVPKLVRERSLGSSRTTTRNPSREGSYRVALFAGGCFWSLESYFEKIPEGIIDVVSGYSGGTSENPTYENYTTGGHKEVVQVTYDPAKISYGALTEYFLRHIDPTDPGGSFFDRGEQYTSAIYYENTDEQRIARDVISIISAEKIFQKPIVTEIVPTFMFWPAEEYHQDYAKKHAVRYAQYRTGSGRDAFLKKTWEGKKATLYTP